MSRTLEQQLTCWPRMTLYEASHRWEALRTESLQTISFENEIATAQGDYYPLARKRAGAEDFTALRDLVLQIARGFGYPSLIRGRRLIEFDQALGVAIHKQMGIMPADAANADVWTFVNAVVLPDIVLWRHGKFDDVRKRWIISEDRLFDLTRTSVGRLWWRVHLLGEEVATKLGEDEAVQLLEKPRIGGFASLSQAIGRRHIHYASEGGTTRRMDLLRDVTKRLIRKMAVQSVYAMGPDQLEEFVDELFHESASALGVELVPIRETSSLHSGPRMSFATDWPIL